MRPNKLKLELLKPKNTKLRSLRRSDSRKWPLTRRGTSTRLRLLLMPLTLLLLLPRNSLRRLLLKRLLRRPKKLLSKDPRNRDSPN